MISLERARVAIITSGAPWVAAHVDALRDAGARVRVCSPDRSLWSTLTVHDHDVILVADVEAGIESIERALSEDGKLRTIPAFALIAPGDGRSGTGDATTMDGATPDQTVAAIAELVDGPSSSIRPPTPTLRPVTMRPASMSHDSPAHRELEAGFHDLRVLLGVVVGYGSNLRDGADGALSDAQRDHVLKMIEAASDATAILEHTMAASRSAALGVPTTQAVGAHRSHVDISALAASVVRVFGRAAEQRHIDLILAPCEPIRLWGNSIHLKQVLANLVVNALKFAPDGGQVRVATRVAVPGHAEILVRDTGAGVPPEDRERIFDHRVRLERDVAVGGTGIGLAVVRELVVVHHGGTVRVGDAEGGGAEFVVSLPLDRRSQSREPSTGREGPSDTRIRAEGAE